FHDAIKAKYPHLKLISSVGFEQPKEKRVQSRQPDVVDEHYYRSTAEFLRMEPNHYERYLRKAPEIFVGEWAAHEEIAPWDAKSRALPPTPSMKAAIGDAAFMASMERNSDLVTMQCYAPLFVNVNPGGRQWRPNLIGYDALRAYGSPSYYAIQMFSRNMGDTIMRPVLSGAQLPVSVTKSEKTGVLFIKLVNPQSEPQPLRIQLKGVRSVAASGTATILAAAPIAENSINAPTTVVPVTHKITGVRPDFLQVLPPYSVTVLQLQAASLPTVAAPPLAVNAVQAPNNMTPNPPTTDAAPQVLAVPTNGVMPLKNAFKGKFLIGTALSSSVLQGNSEEKAALSLKHFDAFTAE
ncbi:hypothetical protein EON80_32000, partial [bacterium]